VQFAEILKIVCKKFLLKIEALVTGKNCAADECRNAGAVFPSPYAGTTAKRL
jgi:hypothetical protein